MIGGRVEKGPELTHTHTELYLQVYCIAVLLAAVHIDRLLSVIPVMECQETPV